MCVAQVVCSCGDREGKLKYIRSDAVIGDVDVGRQILLEYASVGMWTNTE